MVLRELLTVKQHGDFLQGVAKFKLNGSEFERPGRTQLKIQTLVYDVRHCAPNARLSKPPVDLLSSTCWSLGN